MYVGTAAAEVKYRVVFVLLSTGVQRSGQGVNGEGGNG